MKSMKLNCITFEFCSKLFFYLAFFLFCNFPLKLILILHQILIAKFSKMKNNQKIECFLYKGEILSRCLT